MANFATHQRGRLHVHILQTEKFQTRHLSVKAARPLHKETLTATAILPYLWLEGTKNYPSALEITRYADSLFGASVRTGIGKRGDLHVLELYASGPEQAAVDPNGDLNRKVRDLALQVLTEPYTVDGGFATGHVERERVLHKKRIDNTFDDKIAYSMERCLQEMTKGLPNSLPRLGYMEDLDGISAIELLEVHEQVLADADIHVYLIGKVADADAHELLEALEKVVGTGAATRTQSEQLVRAIPSRTGDVHRVTEEQPVSQGKLNLGFRTGVSYGDADYAAMLMCNGVLGGFPHSKLFLNVREKASLAYYASSRLDGLTGVLAVQTGIETGNKEQAEEIILQQVEAMKRGEVTDEELQFTRRGLRNQYQQLLDQPMSMADVHFSGVLAGIHREAEDVLKLMETVTVDDVVRMASHIELDTVYFLQGQEARENA